MKKAIKYKYREFDTWFEDCPKVALGFIYMDSELYVAYNNICDALGITYKQAEAIRIGQDRISFTMDRYNSDKVGVNNRGPEGSSFIKVSIITNELFYTDNARYKCICNILSKMEQDKINAFNFSSFIDVEIDSTSLKETEMPKAMANSNKRLESKWVNNNVKRDIGAVYVLGTDITAFYTIPTTSISKYTNLNCVRAITYRDQDYYALADIVNILSLNKTVSNTLRKYYPSIKVAKEYLKDFGWNCKVHGLCFVPRDTVLFYLDSSVEFTERKKNALITFFKTPLITIEEPTSVQEEKVSTHSVENLTHNNNSDFLVTKQDFIYDKDTKQSIRVGLINGKPYLMAQDICRIYCGMSRALTIKQMLGKIVARVCGIDYIPVGNKDLEDPHIWRMTHKAQNMLSLEMTVYFMSHLRKYKNKDNAIMNIKKQIVALYGTSETVINNNPEPDTPTISTPNVEESIKPVLEVDNITEQINELIKNAYSDKLSSMEHKYIILRKLCDSLGEDIKLLKELN